MSPIQKLFIDDSESESESENSTCILINNDPHVLKRALCEIAQRLANIEGEPVCSVTFKYVYHNDSHAGVRKKTPFLVDTVFNYD